MDKFVEIVFKKSKAKLNMTKVMKYFPDSFFAQLDEFEEEFYTMPEDLCPNIVCNIINLINKIKSDKKEFYESSDFVVYNKDMEYVLDFLMLLDKNIYSKQVREDYSYEIDFLFPYTREIHKEYDEFRWNIEKLETGNYGVYEGNYVYLKAFKRTDKRCSGYFSYFFDFIRKKYNRPDLLLMDDEECHLSDVYIPPNFPQKFFIYIRYHMMQNRYIITSRKYNIYDFKEEVEAYIGMKIAFIKLIK